MTTEKNEEMTSEEVLTCAINIGEQLLVSGAEISRVEDTIRRICNAYGIRQSHIFSIASCIIVTLETKERKWIRGSVPVRSVCRWSWPRLCLRPVAF